MGVPEVMRRVVVSPDSIDVVEAATPEPMPGEVLVHSVVAGVCGSDTHAAHGRHPFIALPYHPGHEVVGVVAARADDVDSVEVGARVTVEPDLPCWNCKQCRRGTENLCENLQFFGCGYVQGGMADYFTIPANRVHVIPDSLDYRAAALVEPMSTPVHAVRVAGDVHGKAVVILGAGTIGLLVLAVAQAHGAKRVVITDPLAAKRERATRLGADVALDAGAHDIVAQARAALGESADVVFDCVAITPTVRQAVEMASKGGTVVVVGVPTGDVAIPLAIVQDHQIRIQGSATYLPEDYAESIRLLVDGTVDVDEIVTAQVSMARAADAYALSAGGEHVKVLVGVDDELLGEPAVN
ncbi:zinc-dependent alcohol dehydrogenase [Mycobacterium deserti]|uniref:Alcohol dehydrogenase catalytic domain-containing protein n=1 Tax=Mycobacterium deserti TaxID=2978347 RepID=A0ABT2ME20_9MYCO|nr:alcohol dehydrogenase catalytic domain-containing protein [Mycobacterium deserti]MCT7659385.1 alcohol dehydrogenase catalytic domain-containing protein [Mycobacterium deserti]